MAETIRLEEFTGVLQNKLVVTWSSAETTTSPWLPTEFMLGQYITRILVVGRSSPASITLGADSSWTQVWRGPGAKEWACLLGILQHMPGPVLLVLGPDIVLTPKLVISLKEGMATGGGAVVVLRSSGSGAGAVGWPAGALEPDHVFFPVLGLNASPLLQVVQEWTSKAMPKALDLKSVLPQLATAGYGLTVAAGLWHWYKPADSPPLVTLTAAQIARQLQSLGTLLEKMIV
jgi:hypothetical protein